MWRKGLCGKIISEGLQWESDVFRREGVMSLSNRIQSAYSERGKPVTIFVKSGEAVVIVPLSAEVTITRTARNG